jgi:hypothetical protein
LEGKLQLKERILTLFQDASLKGTQVCQSVSIFEITSTTPAEGNEIKIPTEN